MLDHVVQVLDCLIVASKLYGNAVAELVHGVAG